MKQLLIVPGQPWVLQRCIFFLNLSYLSTPSTLSFQLPKQVVLPTSLQVLTVLWTPAVKTQMKWINSKIQIKWSVEYFAVDKFC